MKKLEPLTLGLIEEGNLVSDFNREFRKQQEKLCEHVAMHGEKAKKSTAEITLKLTLIVRDPEAEVFAIKASITKKDPQRPAKITTAFGSPDEQPGLFVRASGSCEHADPMQTKICTDDGRPIDTQTGEVAPLQSTGGDA